MKRHRRTDPALGDYARWLEVEGKSPTTIRNYLALVGDFKRFCGHHKTRSADVETWIMRRGGAASYVNLRLAAVKSWCRFSKMPDLTEGISRPRPKRGIPRPIRDLDERLHLFNPSQNDGVICRCCDRHRTDHMEYRARLAAIFLSETGLRISEAYSLEKQTPDSLSYAGPKKRIPDVLHVHGKGGKERLIPLTPKAKNALKKLHGRMPNSVEWLQDEFRKVGISAHALRHTFATRLVEHGADIGAVSKLLGHASPQTTMVYSAYGVDRLRETVALLR